MAQIETVLEQVEGLIRSVKLQDAQERLASLLRTMGPAELRVWEPELSLTISRFLPKRRRQLGQLLQERLAGGDTGDTSYAQTQKAPSTTRPSDAALPHPGRRDIAAELVEVLQYLSDHRIFDWATAYRDQLGGLFERIVGAEAPDEALDINAAVERALEEHANEIYSKGYAHSTRAIAADAALTKSLGGLGRFLDLVLEFYAARLQRATTRQAAQRLRNLTSSMLFGVLSGFGRAEFGAASGTDVLVLRPDRWAHALPFLNGEHVERLCGAVPETRLRTALEDGVQVLCDGLDNVLADATGYLPLPALAQFVPSSQHLDISLQPAAFAPERQLIEIQVYLYPERINADVFERAIERRVVIVLAPTLPPVRALLDREPKYQQIFVPVLTGEVDRQYTEQRLHAALRQSIYRDNRPATGSIPLQYNFAREFPLTRSYLDPHYRVVRNSVRDLLRTFESRNGVRLWCSLRRSGKTTAGLDLDGFGMGSVLINQTCDSTGTKTDDSLLYERVAAALGEAKQINGDFLMTALRQASADASLDGRRAILVLDEYETHFGQLRTATSADERLRYTVAQPLLNQLVAFARDNLLVFLGQQPNAHYILMDQNQLSPYIEQDAFPLFKHGLNSREFTILLEKVLSPRASFDSSFADRIYRETAGHPFLTVNLLVEFVEWLIERKRSSSDLSFTESDVSSFTRRGLRRERLQTSPAYHFFRDGAIPQALSAEGRTRNPWLYSMYTILRHIGREHATLSCSLNDFDRIVEYNDLGYDSEYLLQTGSGPTSCLGRPPRSRRASGCSPASRQSAPGRCTREPGVRLAGRLGPGGRQADV